MTDWWPIIILALLTINLILIIWVITVVGKKHNTNQAASNLDNSIDKTVKSDVERIFDDEFRQELRNRGRLHFEKIISENAMFLQQDLRLTTSQVNEYMKAEITGTLKKEFDTYRQSITDAKNLALESLDKTSDAIEEQRQAMNQEIRQSLQNEKARILQNFETNMAAIINHYVLAAIGDQIDLNDQLEYILSQIEAHKKEIIEDIQNGA